MTICFILTEVLVTGAYTLAGPLENTLKICDFTACILPLFFKKNCTCKKKNVDWIISFLGSNPQMSFHLKAKTWILPMRSRSFMLRFPTIPKIALLLTHIAHRPFHSFLNAQTCSCHTPLSTDSFFIHLPSVSPQISVRHFICSYINLQ